MGQLEPGDHAIWQKKRICKIVERLPELSNPFDPSSAPAPVPIAPYGMTREEWAQICDDGAKFRVEDLKTNEVFTANGFDLLYVNELVLLAVMANLGDDEDGADQ